MSHEYPDRDWTGLPSPPRKVIQGPFDQKRPLWQELIALALALFAGLLIGHCL